VSKVNEKRLLDTSLTFSGMLMFAELASIDLNAFIAATISKYQLIKVGYFFE